jgi:hypothetical protein
MVEGMMEGVFGEKNNFGDFWEIASAAIDSE